MSAPRAYNIYGATCRNGKVQHGEAMAAEMVKYKMGRRPLPKWVGGAASCRNDKPKNVAATGGVTRRNGKVLTVKPWAAEVVKYNMWRREGPKLRCRNGKVQNGAALAAEMFKYKMVRRCAPPIGPKSSTCAAMLRASTKRRTAPRLRFHVVQNGNPRWKK